ncbi:MAG: inositol monophosphatase [Pseudomonadota bacterium]
MGEVLRRAANEAVLPRFCSLAPHEVDEKSPGELVTIADREAERIIASGLKELCPHARIVGEEACAHHPQLLNRIGDGDVWVIDPIDGTGNYAAGRQPFAIMAALLREGEPIASAILNPAAGELLIAERGNGAWINGQRIRTASTSQTAASLTGIVSDFEKPEAMKGNVEKLASQIAQTVPTQRCAGAEYPIIMRGTHDFALYWRTLVWDHAPGVLILEESGGKVARLDGSSFRAGENGHGLLLAHTPEIWDQVAAILN